MYSAREYDRTRECLTRLCCTLVPNKFGLAPDRTMRTSLGTRTIKHTPGNASAEIYETAIPCISMCGRFTLQTPESRIREAFNLAHSQPLGLKPRYNIAPSQRVPIIRDPEAGG